MKKRIEIELMYTHIVAAVGKNKVTRLLFGIRHDLVLLFARTFKLIKTNSHGNI